MRRLFGLPLYVLLAASIGCGAGDAPASAQSQETTRSLLTQLPEGEGATRIPANVTPDVPTVDGEIDIAALGYNRGDSSAVVRVIEMSDYGCGYCRRFHEETFPVILSQFIETGKVEWKFMPYVTGMFENSLEAQTSAECALEQSADLFETVNARLWDEQSTWKGSSDAAGLVRGWAAEAGVNMGTYDSCVSEDRRLQRIATHTALARQLGVRGTPTFFVVGYQPLQGALPTELFTQILDAVYADATGQRATAPGGDQQN